MHKRTFGRTGRRVGEIGFGAWAIGGSWGDVEEGDAVAALNAALDAGVTSSTPPTSMATAARSGSSRRSSSARPRRRLRRHQGRTPPAAADGRGLHLREPHRLDRPEFKNLGVETLDLVQLHCPPTDLYYHPEAFDALDRIKAEGKIRDYGVSVERIEEALKAIEYPGVVSVQIIVNIFRQRPAGLFFEVAKKRDVAVIARVPLASGLLTGKLKANSTFADDDHANSTATARPSTSARPFQACPTRSGSRRSSASGRWSGAAPPWRSSRLRWILMFDPVTVVIPGAKNLRPGPRQRRAADLPWLSDADMAALKAIYDEDIKPYVHQEVVRRAALPGLSPRRAC